MGLGEQRVSEIIAALSPNKEAAHQGGAFRTWQAAVLTGGQTIAGILYCFLMGIRHFFDTFRAHSKQPAKLHGIFIR